MRKYGFGIDIGGTTIKMGLFKVDGTLLEKWEVDTRKEENGKYILEDIAKEIKDKLKEKGIHKNDVVGVGIIINGNIISGTNGAGGEIGHIKVVKNETETCGCGKTGCLEQYASATGIVKESEKLLSSDKSLSILRNYDEVTAKAIFDAAKEGDKLASKLVEDLGEKLGSALATVSCVCDPEVFVIGGGVSKAGMILVNAVRKYFVEKAFHACESTKFELAKLGNDAGIYGGVKLLLEI